MYNVIIVDDEPIIRFGLKSSIDWKVEGLNLVGDFSNGSQALSAMKEGTHVDILITDIKMPVMGGLTLMKKAIEHNPKLKVVLVSSYNEFDYVREGLKHGAVDYVLKGTLEPESFLETIQKCVKRLDEEKALEQKVKMANQTNSIKERKVIEHEIKKLLLNDIERMGLNPKFRSQQGSYIIAYIKMKNIKAIEEEFGFLYKSLLLEEIQEHYYLKHEEGTIFPIGETEMLFLIKETGNSQSVIRTLKEEIECGTSIRFCIGFDTITDLEDIEKGFHHSNEAYQSSFFHTNNDVFKYVKKNERTGQRLSIDKIKEILIPFDREKVEGFLAERHIEWATENLHPEDIKKEASDILTSLFMKRINISVLIDKCTRLQSSESLDELVVLLRNEIEECDQLSKQHLDTSFIDNDLLEKALSYIHEHYTEELTLQILADHIHISRNYFSLLFKRFVNQNFIDYVIELRINRAKDLLSHSTLKVYEVAGESGFKDVKYFSKLFKKMTGMSPGDFRVQQQK